MLHQISIDAPCEIALQQVLCRLFISGFDTLLADALLTAFTLLPLALRGLVASDMDILGRENVHHLIKNVFKEIEGLLLAGTKNVGIDAPLMSDLIRATRAAVLWITGKNSQRMSWHLDFGNHGDMTFSSIVDNLTQLLLGEIATVGQMVIHIGVAPKNSTSAIGTHRRQFRVFLDFHSPSLIIREVEVQGIHVVQYQQLDILFHEINAEEMAAYIEMHPSIAEARGIVNLNRCQRNALVNGVAG